MYTKDKTHRITLRLNDAQMDYLNSNAEMLGITPSELLRQVVNVSMRTSARAQQEMDKAADTIVNDIKDIKKSSDKSVSRETKTSPKKQTAKKPAKK